MIINYFAIGHTSFFTIVHFRIIYYVKHNGLAELNLTSNFIFKIFSMSMKKWDLLKAEYLFPCYRLTAPTFAIN